MAARTASLDSRRRRPEQLLAIGLLAVLGPWLPAAAGQTLQDAVALHLDGRLDEALAAYQRVAAASAESEPNVAAAAHTNSCLIRMARSEYDQALAACERALAIRRRLDEPARLATTLNNLGMALQNLGRFDEAATHFEEALAINRTLDNPRGETQNLANLSAVAIQAGAYGDALDHIEAVLALTAEHPEAEWSARERRVALINEGVVLEKLGAYSAALASYRRALDLPQAIDDNLEALLRVNLGVVYRNLGDPVRAVTLFERAAATYRRTGNTSGLSNALLNLALARHLNLGQPAAAEAAYREALALAAASGDRPEEIQDLFYLATLLSEQGRAGEARELFERALAASEESGSAEGRWSSLAGLGRIAAARGEPARAMSMFERAVAAIEEVRAGLTAERHRAEFFGDKRSVFQAAIQAAADLAATEPEGGHDATAFGLVQRAKARELLDALGERGGGRPLGADEIREGLDGGVLVEYFAAERDLLRWRLDAGGLRMDNLGPAAPTLATVLRVHRALAGGAEPDPADIERLAHRLVGGLDLDSPEPELHIAADAALRYLPFELLPAAPAWRDRRDGLLLEAARVAYLPSGSTRSLLAAAPTPEPGTLAVASPALELGGGRRPAALLAARFGLGELAAAEDELEALERSLAGPARRLTGAGATEAALRGALARGARVVHLATHTVIDERPGQGTAVLLAPAGDDDGLLYPREIAGLDLQAQLAVLAACRTALGDERDGGSLATLTGAFLAAGAGGVVATLWEVGDRATAAFMEQFYWQLGRGAAPAEALRRAKLRFREQAEWRAPHLWSGYVLTGSPPPVAAGGRWGWWTAALALLAIAILLLSYRLPVFLRRSR